MLRVIDDRPSDMRVGGPLDHTSVPKPLSDRGAVKPISRCLVAVCALYVLVGCGGARKQPSSRVFAPGVSDVTAMVARPDGTLRVAIRAKGVIEVISAKGTVGPTLARVPVRTDGQRGLLGVAIDSSGHVFASWTERAGRIVVGQVAPGPTRIVWNGPASADLANGGHIAFRHDRLVIGIGDLLHNDRKNDPAAINGKMVSLDPDGRPDQKPRVISSGWNNPFAFTVVPNGDIWVADNVPGDRGERLTRGDGVGTKPVELPRGTAPAGIDHIGSDELVVCGYKSAKLFAYSLVRDRPERPRVLATDCSTAVATLPDGRVAYAADDGIHVVTP